MIKFVVVEDEINFQKDITSIIENLMFNTHFDYALETFTGYNCELKRAIHDCAFRKIYILDIELDDDKSGIDVAQEIRRFDWDSEIIFITSHDKMFETVYRSVLKVFDFIEKFHSLKSRLEKDLKLIIAQKTDTEKFNFVSNKIKMQVYLKDITHIYRDTQERKLIIQTSNNKFLINMTIVEILSELDSRFKQVHRACIVNTDRVNMYSWSKGFFILDTKEKVDLCSRAFKGSIND